MSSFALNISLQLGDRDTDPVWKGPYTAEVRDGAFFNTSIPPNLTEIFNSATEGTTLSGPLDIQYRAWEIAIDHEGYVGMQETDQGRPYSKGAYQSLTSILLNDRVELFEGVIVDTRNAGVGYRNHTAPAHTSTSKWSEDITWIEPVTECANTNLTVEATTGEQRYNVTELYLRDEGGFVGRPDKSPNGEEWGSQNPDLFRRAQHAAWSTNTLLMWYFNVTRYNTTGPRNSSLGRRFQLDLFIYPRELRGIDITFLTPSFLDVFSSFTNVSSTPDVTNRTKQDWINAGNLCEGSFGEPEPNITNIKIKCGYLYGAAQPLNVSVSQVYVSFTKWRRNLFVCATGVRASIKTVKFAAKGNASLADLTVEGVEDKKYHDDASRPLWAVEKTYRSALDANPFWGMVSDGHENATDLHTYRAEKLWLPLGSQSIALEQMSDSLAATKAPTTILNTIYSGVTVKVRGGLDEYSGTFNMALHRKWEELSSSASTASKIINLIYKQVLATATVGTKSAIRDRRSDGLKTPLKVTNFSRTLKYDLRYGIPAIIVLFIVLCVLVGLIVCIFTRFSMNALSQLVNQTSTGRIVTNLLHPDTCDPQAPTSTWLKAAGSLKLLYPFSKAEYPESSPGNNNDESNKLDERNTSESDSSPNGDATPHTSTQHVPIVADRITDQAPSPDIAQG